MREKKTNIKLLLRLSLTLYSDGVFPIAAVFSVIHHILGENLLIFSYQDNLKAVVSSCLLFRLTLWYTIWLNICCKIIWLKRKESIYSDTVCLLCYLLMFFCTRTELLPVLYYFIYYILRRKHYTLPYFTLNDLPLVDTTNVYLSDQVFIQIIWLYKNSNKSYSNSPSNTMLKDFQHQFQSERSPVIARTFIFLLTCRQYLL